MAAGRADGVRGRDHARTDDHAVVDGVAQSDVDEVAGADIAHRGEARFERALRVQRGRVRLLDRKAQHLLVERLVEILLKLAVQVRMRVDEARQQRRVAEIDHLGVRRRRAADRHDLVAFDDDRSTLRELARLAVEQVRRFQHDRPSALRAVRGRYECRRDGGDDHRLEKHESNLQRSLLLSRGTIRGSQPRVTSAGRSHRPDVDTERASENVDLSVTAQTASLRDAQ